MNIMSNRLAALVFSSLTIVIYFLTVFPATRDAVNSMFVLYIFIGAIGFVYYPFIKNNTKNPAILNLYIVTLFTAILLWVGVTGWFYSPFFYLLYLLAVMLSFLFSPLVTLAFVIVLMGLFSPNIGSIDMIIDIITMLSLFSVVPLTYFLQKEYLKLKEHENKVLILENEKKNLKNSAEEVLLNKVINFSAQLRQPVNDMKQIALVAQKDKISAEMNKYLKKINTLAETSLKSIEDFEEAVTGRKLVHTRKKK